MFFSARPSLSRTHLPVGIAMYVLALGLAATVIVLGLHRAGHTVLQQLALGEDGDRGASGAPLSVKTAQAAPATLATPSTTVTTVQREGAMTPLQGRWDDRMRPRYSGPQFGSSSRNSSRWGSSDRFSEGDDDDNDDDNRPAAGGTFRTLCVRLCDGYYFPISFSVTRDRLERDAETCANSCGTQGRLFVQRSPDGSPEDMQDLAGRPYRQLRTAFLYRSEYVESCKCQPHPWEKEALDRHRMYALAAAPRRGDQAALKELRTRQAGVGQASRPAAAAAPPVDASTMADAETAQARKNGTAEELGGERAMRLGTEGATNRPRASPAPEPRRQARDTGWQQKAFQQTY